MGMNIGLESLRMTSLIDGQRCSDRMDMCLMGKRKIRKLRAKESSVCGMETFMRGTLRMTRGMGMVFSHWQIKKNMKDNGRIIRETAKESNIEVIKITMMVSGKMIKNMGKEKSFLQTG